MNTGNPFTFEQMEKLNMLNNQAFFLNEFTHKFNNPLNSIHMASELLKKYTQDLQDVISEPEHMGTDFRGECGAIIKSMPQLLRGISDSTIKLNQLVSWLSDFSGRGAAAGMNSMDLNWLITHAASLAQHQISAYSKNVTVDLDPALPILPGNPLQMLHVILNLLRNALMSLPDPSCAVTLSTLFDRDATGSLQLCVQDEGVGISPEAFPKILEPFFSTWTEHGCMGLGLTVANRIILGYGGSVVIDSVPGKGTCVRVSLPLPVVR